MSTPQRNDARRISVGPDHRELLRVQSLAVLSFNHDGFEDIIDAEPAEATAMATIYRDAFAVLDAVGWTTTVGCAPVDVQLTAGHVNQLRRLRSDLALTLVGQLAAPEDVMSGLAACRSSQRLVAQLRVIEGLRTVLAAYRSAAKA